MPADTPAKELGSCCEGLKDALTNTEFEPLLAIDEETGVLYMSVGIMTDDDDEEEGPSMVDHPVYYCPFCGTHLQTPEEVEAKMGAEAA